MPLSKANHKNMSWRKHTLKKYTKRGRRVPSNSQEKKEQAQAEFLAEVKNWWVYALAEGCVFNHVPMENVEAGIDYFGSMPWPTEVSLQTLHADFIESGGRECSRHEFARAFRSVSGVTRGRGRRAEARGEDGRKLFQSTRTFYFIEDLLTPES